VSLAKNLKTTINYAASPTNKKIALYDKAPLTHAFSLQLLKLAVDIHTHVYQPLPPVHRASIIDCTPTADVINVFFSFCCYY
jgi:hypothetical protein